MPPLSIPPPSIPKSDLLARLSEGHAAGVTVVTPNTRLSQAVQRDFDDFQAGRGLSVWEAADILPFGAFVQRLYEDALYADLAAPLPLLLTAVQEQMLWRQAIEDEKTDLLAIGETAAACQDAWRLVHAWRIGRGHANEDAAAFSRWSETYRRRTAAEVDSARLPDLVSKLLAETKIRRPKVLVAYAFDILPPQTAEFLQACAALDVDVRHCHPERRAGSASRTSYPSSREELEAAAGWARARLEQGGGRIGVVVPELQQRRREVVRVFTRVLGAPRAFNVSLGQPLAEYPLVAAALSLVEFSQKEIEFERSSALLRSPFIGGAESEMAARAMLDARIRRDAPASISLPKLTGLVESCPLLRQLLEKIFSMRPPDSLAPPDWARHFSALLDAAGFPGERSLDSQEFQARAKWHEALGEFAKLERVAARMPFSQAHSILRKLCNDILFQPESSDAPIQVLGILESAGAQFDRLWVSGLTDEAWPLKARPNPFIPAALQKKAGIPEASAESSLALDKKITAQWLSAAGEVVVSHPQKDKDRDLAPSPLILAICAGSVEIPAFPRHRDRVFAQKALSSLDDSSAPRVEAKRVRGGTRVLSDQAACPFRAFARWRLGAEPLEAPAEGLDAAKRGSLLHALMKHLWLALKDSAALSQDLGPAIAAAAQAAVEELEIEGRFAELERARLARLAREWLGIEAARKDFEVVAVEKTMTFEVAGIEYAGRIDRMDRLRDGGHVLVDYKTGGTVTTTHWKTPRPHDPQLPLYAVSSREEISSIAFAKVRPGDMRFVGYSKEEKVIPNVKKFADWKKLLGDWKAEIEALGAAFASGEARVDPKNELVTCRNCALHTLCRVYEKVNVLAEPEEAE